MGSVVAPHGIRGEVRVKPRTTNPGDFTSYGSLYDAQGEKTWQVSVTGHLKGTVVCRIDGVNDRNTAESLRGLTFHVPRKALPSLDDDEFYYTDLIGMDIRSAEGERLGQVKYVMDHGAGDILTIAFDDGSEDSYLFTQAIFPVVSLNENYLIFRRPDVVIVDENAKTKTKP